MPRPVRTVAALAALGLLAACAEEGGGAAGDPVAYPSEEIRLLVPYGAGGPTDLTARAYGASLEEQLGQTVVVENLPGGSGASATQELIAAEPDGHTLSLVTAGTLVLTPLANEVGYSKDDVTPIGVMAEVPSVLAVGSGSPYQSAEDFFTAAEQQPGVITVGVPGASTPQGIELQRLREEYGVEVTAVPFNGNAEMTTACSARTSTPSSSTPPPTSPRTSTAGSSGRWRSPRRSGCPGCRTRPPWSSRASRS
jgi:tripartite-type tricarboxylate transporter receptor subunit TctC